MIDITDGNKGSGKSLFTAWKTLQLLRRNISWFESGKTKMKRYVVTNQELSQSFTDEYQDYLKIWNELDEIPELRECDLIYDDMNKDLDGQHYLDTPRDFKAWLRLSEHYGVDIYGNTQDFVTLDPTVRRMTDIVRHVFKMFGSARPYRSMPEVKRIYGLIGIKRVDPEDFKKEKAERVYSWRTSFMWITPNKTSLFNTQQIMKQLELPPYKCFERTCTNPNHKDAYGRPFRHFYHAK